MEWRVESAIRGCHEEGIPQRLKPSSIMGFVAKAEALAYLEATALGGGTLFLFKTWT